MRKVFRYDGVLFSVDIDKRTGTEYVTSHHPYDLQEYHWARRSPKNGNWVVYRGYEAITCYEKELSAEEVAEMLACHDEDIIPCIDRS